MDRCDCMGMHRSAEQSAGMTPREIRDLRHALGMSVDKFAGELGFTGKNRAVTVYRWETGTRKPSAQTILLMKQLKHLDAASR
jgi:DNA-binding transcriptional regulator YiaG